MKIFISQPMGNRSRESIEAERKDIIDFLKNKYPENDIEIIDSYLCNKDKKPLEMLGESIKLLAQADLVCFAENFRLARGCRVEYQCALNYSIPIVYYREQKDV